MQGAIDELSRTIGYTVNSKNYLPNNNATITSNGITYTVNSDKSVTVNGTNSLTWNNALDLVGNSAAGIGEEIKGLIDGVEYTLNGCQSGGSDDTYRILFIQYDTNGTKFLEGSDIGNGFKFTHRKGYKYRIYIGIGASKTVTNVVFKPMISIEGGEYEPYVEDVQTQIKGLDGRILTIKEKQMTVTTDANGNALTAMSSNTDIINVKSNTYQIGECLTFIPCVANTYWYIRILRNHSAYSPFANKEITLIVRYLE